MAVQVSWPTLKKPFPYIVKPLNFDHLIIQIAQNHSAISAAHSWIVIGAQGSWLTLRRPFPYIVKPSNSDHPPIQIAQIHSTTSAMHS
jgi:hypothetical protein